MNIDFRQVESRQDAEHAKVLVLEYLNWLNDHLQARYAMEFDVNAMVESDVGLGKFSPPSGRFYLTSWKSEIAGVGCLKQLEPEIGEIQRMYVLPRHRGKRIGRAIAERLIADARAISYKVLRLESLEFLHSAHALYRSLGFREIEPYPGNSMESYQDPGQLAKYYSITVFMELVFDREASAPQTK